MAWIGEAELRQRVAAFEKELTDTEYTITENKYRNYLAKYIVFKNKQAQGNLLFDYSKKKQTISCRSEKMEALVFQELKQLFDGQPARPSPPTKAELQPEAGPYEKVTAYYEILKPYRTKNFDFRCFAEALAHCAGDEVIRKEILGHSDSFDDLERDYHNLMAR